MVKSLTGVNSVTPVPYPLWAAHSGRNGDVTSPSPRRGGRSIRPTGKSSAEQYGERDDPTTGEGTRRMAKRFRRGDGSGDDMRSPRFGGDELLGQRDQEGRAATGDALNGEGTVVAFDDRLGDAKT